MGDEFGIGGVWTKEAIKDKIDELRLKPSYGYDGRNRIEEAIRILEQRLDELDSRD